MLGFACEGTGARSSGHIFWNARKVIFACSGDISVADGCDCDWSAPCARFTGELDRSDFVA